VLPGQVSQILQILIEHQGSIVTREEIKKKLWPDDTVVEFDHSIDAVMKKLRKPLGDSFEDPNTSRPSRGTVTGWWCRWSGSTSQRMKRPSLHRKRMP